MNEDLIIIKLSGKGKVGRKQEKGNHTTLTGKEKIGRETEKSGITDLNKENRNDKRRGKQRNRRKTHTYGIRKERQINGIRKTEDINKNIIMAKAGIDKESGMAEKSRNSRNVDNNKHRPLTEKSEMRAKGSNDNSLQVVELSGPQTCKLLSTHPSKPFPRRFSGPESVCSG